MSESESVAMVDVLLAIQAKDYATFIIVSDKLKKIRQTTDLSPYCNHFYVTLVDGIKNLLV